MNKSTITKASSAAIVGTAAVWFGSHAGGGFATGNQAMNFYVRFGYHSVWIPVISMLILAICFREGLILARHYGVYDYKSFMKHLFAPYDKIFANLFDICYMIMALLAVGAAIAGAAALLQQVMHIPYLLGVLLTGSVLLVLTIFGADLVRNASTVMAIAITFSVLVLVYVGIKAGAANFHSIMASQLLPLGMGKALLMGLIYAGFQSFLIAPIVSVAEPLDTKDDINKTALLGFVLNATLLALVCIMLLGFFPASAQETLPTYFVCEQLGYPWLKILYSLVLFLALISTGVTLIFATVMRFEKVWTSGRGIFEKVINRRIAMSVLLMLFSMSISLFGLTAIVVKGYGMMGYIGIFLIIIPLLIVAPIKNRKNIISTDIESAP